MHELWKQVWATIHTKPSRFFRIRLLASSPEAVKNLIEQFEKDVENIKTNALSLSWYMRGGVSYEDILNMSSFERQAISDLVENNLEVTKKSNLPFF